MALKEQRSRRFWAGLLFTAIGIGLATVPTLGWAEELPWSTLSHSLVARTKIWGRFDGCRMGKTYQTINNRYFFCDENQMADAYEPELLVLKNNYTQKYLVLIDSRPYRGRLF